LGLAGKEFGEEAFAEHRSELEDAVLDVGEGGAPGRAVGAVALVGEEFRAAVRGGVDFFHLGCGLFGVSHPWVLSGVRSKERSDFPGS